MDIERTLETQRLRLLRIVAGLLVVVGFFAVGPVSRGFSDWVTRYVGSVLSRAEAAARCLVMTQACVIAARGGLAVDRGLLSAALAPEWSAEKPETSLAECQRRLQALRAVLLDVPRHALRLLRRIEKHMRRALRAARLSPCPGLCPSASLSGWRLGVIRIERPPDKASPASLIFSPPPDPRREAKAVGQNV